MSNDLKSIVDLLERKFLEGEFLEGARLIKQPLGGDRSIAGYKDETEGRPAAVLIPLLLGGGELTVFFTKRPETMKEHPGQISFPGGSQDVGDITLIETALREAEEEVGLDPALVRVVGGLNRYRTITGYTIDPVIGLVEERFSPKLDATEVAGAFEAPLVFFLDKANARKHTRIYKGRPRPYYAFDFEGRIIWGATAAMLINLREALLAFAGMKG